VQQNRLRALSNLSWRLGPGRVAVPVRDYLAILRSLEAGEARGAAEAMRRHLGDAVALAPPAERHPNRIQGTRRVTREGRPVAGAHRPPRGRKPHCQGVFSQMAR